MKKRVLREKLKQRQEKVSNIVENRTKKKSTRRRRKNG